MLHLLDGLVEGDDVGDLEECRLHDSIGARTESEVGRDLGGVDDVELDVVTRHVRLHVVGQRSARRSGVVDRVEQERAALFEAFQHVVLVDIRRHVACHEIGRGNKIGRRNGVVAEAQVRRGVTARLLRVVREVCLTVLVGRTADYLDRVLVGTHRSVGAQTEEESLERTALGHRYLCADGDRVHRNVVDDTNREVVLGLGGGEIVVHGKHLCRRGVLRRETVASADNHRAIVRLVEYVLDVEQERLAIGTRLLGAVEYADALDRRGQHFEQILRREGAVEVYGNDTHLATLSRQVVDALLDSLGNRAHSDDYMLGILGTVIGKGLVGASRDARNLGHSLGHHVGHGVVELVGSLARLEIYVGVLSRTARNGVGANAVMIGRAALGNPWIVKQTTHYLETGELLEEPKPAEKIAVAKEHLHRLVEAKGEVVGPKEFRSQAAYYLKGIPRSARTKAALNSADTEQEMQAIFDNFLADMIARPIRR